MKPIIRVIGVAMIKARGSAGFPVVDVVILHGLQKRLIGTVVNGCLETVREGRVQAHIDVSVVATGGYLSRVGRFEVVCGRAIQTVNAVIAGQYPHVQPSDADARLLLCS